MLPTRVTSQRERDRTSALAAGLAATVICWTFAVAFAEARLEYLAPYSAWIYGPVVTAIWALFSAIAYLLIGRHQREKAADEPCEGYRCREFPQVASANWSSVCADPEEKTRLAGITAGFALTISAWVAALSFMPESCLEWLGEAPAWTCCVVSVTLWAALSGGMYRVFRALR
ncbi:MAG TPA: hypothetical protein VGI29_08660 [Candidatus Binataceae bacterium]|jgi:hypothetical protein